jgi:hypothetical protein
VEKRKRKGNICNEGGRALYRDPQDSRPPSRLASNSFVPRLAFRLNNNRLSRGPEDLESRVKIPALYRCCRVEHFSCRSKL